MPASAAVWPLSMPGSVCRYFGSTWLAVQLFLSRRRCGGGPTLSRWSASDQSPLLHSGSSAARPTCQPARHPNRPAFCQHEPCAAPTAPACGLTPVLVASTASSRGRSAALGLDARMAVHDSTQLASHTATALFLKRRAGRWKIWECGPTVCVPAPPPPRHPRMV